MPYADGKLELARYHLAHGKGRVNERVSEAFIDIYPLDKDLNGTALDADYRHIVDIATKNGPNTIDRMSEDEAVSLALLITRLAIASD